MVFVHDDDSSDRIHLHKPHPENTVKGGALKAVKAYLIEKGHIECPAIIQELGDDEHDDL